jgi:outer membrane protein TolC
MTKAMRVPGALLVGLALWARGAAALDLATALQEVAASNPEIAASNAMAAAGRERIRPAGAWVSPMVEAGVVNVPQTGRFDTDPMTMKMVGVSQRVPVFGSNGLARRSAIAAADATTAAAEMKRYEVLGMAWENYADAFFAAEMAREAAAHQGAVDRLAQSARARYASGAGRLEDVLGAEAEKARLFVDLAGFRAEERSARARLDALRGVNPRDAGETLAPPPESPAPAAVDAWLAAIVPAHPRLRESAAQTGRYRFAAQAARRAVWPDLELRGSYGRRETLTEGHEIGPQDDMFSASVGFMVPIFAGSRERSEAAEMDAMARASEAESRGVELDLRRDVTIAWAAAEAADRTIHLLADTVVATQRRAVEVSWTSYRSGAIDLWQVFDANHALYSEALALLRARNDLARAQARFLSLTGRGDLVGVALPTRKGSER